MNASEKIKIFLVDDDDMFVDSLKHTLSGKRTEVRSFSTGEECIENMFEQPHIIVLDYALNNSLNGVQVLNQIKQASPETQVIMLSGIDNVDIMKDTMKYGAYDFIEKGESAIFKVKKEINAICDEIESNTEVDKEDSKILWINAGIIVLIVVAFILTHVK
jgi:two-component system OmpR family response regulator